MKKYDVVALGELLIDFTRNGMSEQGNHIYEANPGGAPGNVLAMLTKLGKQCSFIGKVGNDMFGKMLKETITSLGVESSGIVLDSIYNTSLAFVKNQENGERDFVFYRNPGADMMLGEQEIDFSLIEQAKIFHFGTLSMTHKEVRNATRKAIQFAKEKNALLSFDPNLREPLWDSLEVAREQIIYGLKQCDILKISDNELSFVTGESSLEMGIAKIKNDYPNIKLINLTAGANGSYSYYKNYSVYQPAYKLGNVIETTGAGDTFCASVLYYILEFGLESFDQKKLEEMLQFANAAAYLVTTRRGALCSMPTKTEIDNIISTQ